MFNVVSLLVSLVLVLAPLCTVTVSNIECVPGSSVKVSFMSSEVTDHVYFKLNNVNYIANYNSTTHIYTKNISVTYPYTSTITSAYILVGGTKYYATNVPFVKVLNCTPNSVVLNDLTVSSHNDSLAYGLLVVSILGFIVSYKLYKRGH